MRPQTVIAIGLLAAIGVWGYRRYAPAGRRADLDARLRAAIAMLPPERTTREQARAKDAATSLGQNVGTYAAQGSIGGPYGAAGGAAFGLIKEWLD